MIRDKEAVQGQRILQDVRIRDTQADRLSRMATQTQLQRWMGEPLVLECNVCSRGGEAENGDICSEGLCIICCCRLGCECRVQPAECMGCENTVIGGGLCCECREGGDIEDLGPMLFEDRSSDEAADGEDGEEWIQTEAAAVRQLWARPLSDREGFTPHQPKTGTAC